MNQFSSKSMECPVCGVDAHVYQDIRGYGKTTTTTLRCQYCETDIATGESAKELWKDLNENQNVTVIQTLTIEEQKILLDIAGMMIRMTSHIAAQLSNTEYREDATKVLNSIPSIQQIYLMLQSKLG